MQLSTYQQKLSEALKNPKDKKAGLYAFLQCRMAYHSNAIEGRSLTEEQVIELYLTDKIASDTPDTPIRRKDIEEIQGHFRMFDHMIETLDEPLSEDLIKTMHYHLKTDVFEDAANGYPAGEYKTKKNTVSSVVTSDPKDVPKDMETLLAEYNEIPWPSLLDLTIFHARFENIHPFQDGNGRVGRMILLRECLINDFVPILIKNDDKSLYYYHLLNAQMNRQYQGLLDFFETERKAFYWTAMLFIE
ncbi:MAG: Fic family protein [Clostridiales bacterium]|nr:Fic family protein [Clostridiales bacterium]